MRKRVSKMPRRPGMISDMRFRGEMPRGGGFGNLGEAIRRLQEQRGGNLGSDFRAPRMPGMDFGDQIFYKDSNKTPSMPIAFNDPSFRMIGTPQPIPERMPIDPSSYYNPTIFGQQMGDMDFSQMPEISPVDMSNLQMPTLPREISQMDIPQMPEGLPSMQDVQGGRDLQQDFPTQRRMMMARGDVAEKETLMDFLTKDRRGRKPGNAFSLGKDIYDFANQPEPSTQMSPEQEIFSLQTQLKNLEEQLRMDRSYNDDQAVIDTSAQMAAIQNRIKELLQESGQTISNTDRAQLSGGGDFPDLTGDGKVTQADILKGRGVYAEGDEVMMMQETDMMAPGNQEIEASLMEVQGMQQETQALDQYVQMVTQMIQAGASEAEVIESLRQAGLDDDDIAAVFQAVMETMQGSMEQGGIDSELAQLS